MAVARVGDEADLAQVKDLSRAHKGVTRQMVTPRVGSALLTWHGRGIQPRPCHNVPDGGKKSDCHFFALSPRSVI